MFYICYLFPESAVGPPQALSDTYGCSQTVITGTSEARHFRRVCSIRAGGGLGARFAFGDPKEDTQDIEIAFLDGDAFPDVLTSSAYDHMRVYTLDDGQCNRPCCNRHRTLCSLLSSCVHYVRVAITRDVLMVSFRGALSRRASHTPDDVRHL